MRRFGLYLIATCMSFSLSLGFSDASPITGTWHTTYSYPSEIMAWTEVLYGGGEDSAGNILNTAAQGTDGSHWKAANFSFGSIQYIGERTGSDGKVYNRYEEIWTDGNFVLDNGPWLGPGDTQYGKANISGTILIDRELDVSGGSETGDWLATWYVDTTLSAYPNYEATLIAKFSSDELGSGGTSNSGVPYINGLISEATISVSTVPIPGAVWLLGSGLIGLVGLRRKFKG